MASHLSLKRLYNHYNRKYFNSELPTDIQIMYSPLDGAHGKCWVPEKIIHIDTPLLAHVNYLKIIVLHEMAHMKCGRHVTHGKKFQEEKDRLYYLGAYRDLL